MTRLASPLEAVCGLYTTFLKLEVTYVQNIEKAVAQIGVALRVATIFKKMCSSLAFF